MAPRLSVVIVHSGAPAPLARCLDALELCRARIELEAIVVDNGSEEGTLDLVRQRFPWVEMLANAERRGFTFGVNRGFSRARAQAVLMLSPDCKPTPEALEWLLRALACEPTLAAAAPALLDREGLPARSCGRFPSLWTLVCDQLGLARAFPDSTLFGRYRYGGRWHETLGHVDWASGAALLIPLSLWRELGGLDENIFLALEEVDWCRRAALAGHRVRYVPMARVSHLGREEAREIPEDTYLHHLRSRVYYVRKHHGAAKAFAARAILSASLILRWAAASMPRRRRGHAGGSEASGRICAAGLGAVWAGEAR